MRYATKERTTKETDIQISLRLDGSGKADVHTGIGFFDHMLTLLSFHSQMDLTLLAQGDLEVCDHHCIEDCGILLGQCFKRHLVISEAFSAMALAIYRWTRHWHM